MKLTIGLALLLSSFVGTASTIVNHHNVQESIQKNFNKTSLQDDPRTTLVTVFGTIPNYTCKDGLPSEIDVISYLKGIVPTQYADVINDIQIDSIGSGVINFSAVQYSRAYTGSDSFNYVIPTKVSLANVFGVSLSGQEVNINNTFNYS
jgi:hypothetical protein